MRFDIVPYGSTISATTVALGAGVVLPEELVQEVAFDDLPFGLMNAPTLSVKLVYNRLPTALQTALETMMSGAGDRNLYLLWSDRGAGVWTVEFAGTEEQVDNMQFARADNGDEVITVALVDALYHAALALRASDVFAYNSYAPKQYMRLLEIATPDYDRTEITSDGEYVYDVRIRTFTELAIIMKTALSTYLVTNVTRTTNVSAAATVDAADSTVRLGDWINTGARFYKASSTFPRVKGAELTAATAQIISHVNLFYTTVVGGLFSSNDDYSFAKEQSLLDVLKSISETMCVKVSWIPVYVADAGGDYIAWQWEIACLFANGRDNVVLTNINIDAVIESGDVERGSGVISRVEVRFPLSSKDQDRNVTEVEYTAARSRGERSINIEPILHNVPSMKDKVLFVNNAWNAYQTYITQTNLICYDSDLIDDQMDKAHEDTRIVVVGAANGGAATTFVDVSVATAHPNLFSNQFENKASMDVDPSQSILLQSWINEVQRLSCLPYALARTLFLAFSSPRQAALELTIITNASSVPAILGRAYQLTGARVSLLPTINWARACVVAVKCDWIAGTSAVTYFLPDLSNF